MKNDSGSLLRIDRLGLPPPANNPHQRRHHPQPDGEGGLDTDVGPERGRLATTDAGRGGQRVVVGHVVVGCLLYTSDAADE